MQVFKAFIKIGYKKLPSILIYLIVFGILAVIMSRSSANSGTNSFQTTSLTISIIDLDKSDASRALTSYLSGIHHVVSLKNDKNTLLDSLYYRNTVYVLRIPSGFETALQSDSNNRILDNISIPDSYSGSFVNEQISSYLSNIKLYLAAGESLQKAVKSADHDFAKYSSDVSVLKTKDNGQSQIQYAGYYFQYLPYILLSMLISGMTPLLTVFRKKDLDMRIRCSSLSLMSRNLQLALGCVLYSVISWAVIVLMGIILYHHQLPQTQLFYSLINSFALLLTCLGISLFVSSFSPKDSILSMISNVISLGMSFLCGIFVPLSMLGDSVIQFSQFLPFYWYVRNNNMLASYSNEVFKVSSFWKYTGIELLFAVTLFFMTLVASKYGASRKSS